VRKAGSDGDGGGDTGVDTGVETGVLADTGEGEKGCDNENENAEGEKEGDRGGEKEGDKGGEDEEGGDKERLLFVLPVLFFSFWPLLFVPASSASVRERRRGTKHRRWKPPRPV
jgi:hypothetical protein